MSLCRNYFPSIFCWTNYIYWKVAFFKATYEQDNKKYKRTARLYFMFVVFTSMLFMTWLPCSYIRKHSKPFVTAQPPMDKRSMQATNNKI